ncbi:MAG TPA: endonuclease Q family protein [Syntrophales bacterium]|nr:endonuclease Q family protein [Syntrophales bacterium]
MRFIADLHIHSKYSIATSRDLSPENIWKWAQLKGITVIGTGDITHPGWFKELKEKIVPAGNGLFCLKKKYRSHCIPDSCNADVFFLLSGEISCIYSKKGKTRKIHSLILLRDFADAAKLNMALSKIGTLTSDGRPILRLDVKELLKIALGSSADAMLVPAHAWTPHFSVFGAASGFDSLKDCFEELTHNIYTIETGLSSDPAMNWRLSFLNKITLISNSDAHSPSRIGREASIFDTEISYGAITDAIKTRRGFAGTIEFFPEEGKYYYDGHRSCGISTSPKETVKHNYLCPVCGKKVTLGVMHRIEILADKKMGFKPKGSPPFYSIIPLNEIIAETHEVGVTSMTVKKEYIKLLQDLGSEFKILMDVPLKDISDAGSHTLQEAISRVRAGHVHIKPGFDGEYGKIKIFGSSPERRLI